MPGREPLDSLPLWALFGATVALVLLAIEAGFRLGRWRQRGAEHERETPVGAIVGAILGLLAFLLAFTFGMAASRFDTRRELVLDEANAIGTTYLRAALLPEPQRAEVRALLRDYVDLRLEAVQPGKAAAALERSEELQGRLWAQAVTVAEKRPTPITGLFVQSLNEVIDLHSKRVTLGLRNRIPVTIWGALYWTAILAMAGVGYHAGLTSANRTLATLALAVTFSGVLWLIADLDRPQEGLLKVSQQAMIDLQKSLTPAQPVAVGTALAGGPPRRSVRAELPHTALTSGAWRRSDR
jgi:hypothetical protein